MSCQMFGVHLGPKAALALSVGLALTAVTAHADDRWMSDSALLQKFHDVTLEGRYASGKSFTERYGADGRIAYTERGVTIGGHWSVTQGTFCTIYDTDPAGGCYRVMRVSENCYEFYFVSRTEENAPGPQSSQPSWTARGSIGGQSSACQDGANV